ncbi:ABC transporter ATP-binding protein [Actinomyces minihominis]|uniref:ABC transporter ATP-binding protein n=1 Tax=Actinomyces minihominis TaxID=2002838 RepID=UPI000C07A82E|nr:ABC transporter ATP-binding protein [Actinomyces minihominis]
MSGPGHGPGGPGGRAPAKAKDFKGTLKRLLKMLSSYWWMLGAVALLSIGGVILGVLAPRILGYATNTVFNGYISSRMPAGSTKQEVIEGLRAQGETRMADMLGPMDIVPGQGVDFSALANLLLVVVAIYVGSAFLGWASGQIARVVVQNTGWNLRQRIQDKINRLPLSYLDRHSRGDILSRVTNDVDNITQTLQQTITQFLSSVFMIIGIAVMMLTMSWSLTLIALFVIPVGAIVAGILMKKAQPQFRKQWKATGAVSGVVEESVTGHTVATLFNLQEKFDAEFRAENDHLYRSSFKAQFISNLVNPVMSFVSNLSYVVIAVGGAVMVTAGTLTIGEVQAFIQYSRQFTQPVGQLASIANLLQSGLASAERVFDFLDAPDMAPDTGTKKPSGEGHVEFRNVRFGYNPDKPVIKNLNLDVAPGQMVAIIGPTGAGKTTLVNLLERFYEVDSGEILVDGINITEIKKDTLRRHIGMVLQETWLFDGTIEDNIAFGRSGATPEEVRRAARETSVDRLIRQLPEGYETRISDDGDTLSVGERQLLTIARAFIADPEMLILDEATSSVDTRTEVLVQAAMDNLRQGRTAFVIAHRLSTIRNADLILVMQDGDVVEQGTHDQLLAVDGAYARLYRAQFAGPYDPTNE